MKLGDFVEKYRRQTKEIMDRSDFVLFIRNEDGSIETQAFSSDVNKTALEKAKDYIKRKDI